MSNHNIYSNILAAEQIKDDHSLKKSVRAQDFDVRHSLPALMTKAASKQTYYTIRFFVDHGRVLDAYRAYAYFRWVDDWIDETAATKAERIAFIARQQRIINCCYLNMEMDELCREEKMLVDLIQRDQEPASGLQSYIRNMMAVMAFDASRRDRLISQAELTQYSTYLSTAVTDALHYFIGHIPPALASHPRYVAVVGAHITHMLRDTFEDTTVGYYNVPLEFLEAHQITPRDLYCDAYREWVKNRVQLARDCFAIGRRYMAQVSNLRCRIAGYAYTARFEVVLDLIERDRYQLRPAYPERKSLRSALKMSWLLISMLAEGLRQGKS